MNQYDFTVGFAILAENEIDARVKLADLFKAISKDEIFKAMRLVVPDALTGDDARDLLKALGDLTYAIEQYVDEDGKPHPYIWDDYAKALEVIKDYGTV